MTYDPQAYWQEAATNPDHQDHQSQFVYSDVFKEQEERLIATLETLEFASILEVGCGWGRITKLVHERWPDVPYTATDLSVDRIKAAAKHIKGVKFEAESISDLDSRRRYDLVLGVETLMHVPPSLISESIEKLCRLSRRYVVNLDWNTRLSQVIAAHNFIHDYRKLYGERLVSEEQIGLQAIYVAKPLIPADLQAIAARWADGVLPVAKP